MVAYPAPGHHVCCALQTPKLATRGRVRPTHLRSRESMEVEAIAARPPFRAQPVKCELTPQL